MTREMIVVFKFDINFMLRAPAIVGQFIDYIDSGAELYNLWGHLRASGRGRGRRSAPSSPLLQEAGGYCFVLV